VAWEKRKSFFPQALPLLPQPALTWPLAANDPTRCEVVRVISLNGIPMGFHGSFISQLHQVYGKAVQYGECWR